jgi:hypothetical protein
MELMSWLLMEEVEPGTQFIPQYGDQVVYLRQVRKIFARALFTAFMFMYVCSRKIL